MRAVSQLQVLQVRIFPADRIPFLKLAAPAIAQAFAKRLGDAQVGALTDSEINFARGTYLSPDGKAAHLIKVVQISPRKISLLAEASSPVANEIYGLITQAIAEIDNPLGEPLLVTEETSCSATLDCEWTAFVSEAIAEFAQDKMLTMLQGPARPDIRGLGFSFRLGYGDPPDLLRQNGITLADKIVTIEPRVQTPLSERRYFTSSPTDSDTHIRLLEEIERILALPEGVRSKVRRSSKR